MLRLAGDTGSTTTMSAAALAHKLLVPLELVDAKHTQNALAGDEAGMREAVDDVIFGPDAAGLQRILRRVARTAWAARDRLSLDTWRAIYALTTRHTPRRAADHARLDRRARISRHADPPHRRAFRTRRPKT